MYLQHFGLTHAPLGKKCKTLWDKDGQLGELQTQFKWLLDSPGVGILTAEPGLGKTAMMRHLTAALSPHQYQVVYICETDFRRLEFYRQLAMKFGLEPRYRRTQQWKELKEHITDLMDNKNILPLLIIDEAQNLSSQFWNDFPSFLNFAFDSRDMMTVWFLGHPQLAMTLNQGRYAAMQSRIHSRHKLHPLTNKEEFTALVQYGFKEAGYNHPTIMSDTGIEYLRVSSQGKIRIVHRLLVTALQIAANKQESHLSDDVIQQAIKILQG